MFLVVLLIITGFGVFVKGVLHSCHVKLLKGQRGAVGSVS